MTLQAVVAAALIGLACAALARVVIQPKTPLDVRLRPYVQLRRTRLGGQADLGAALVGPPIHTGTVRRIFGPIVDRVAQSLSAVIDAGGDEAIGRRLRHAGIAGVDPREYRMRQLGRVLVGVVAGGLMGAWAAAAFSSPPALWVLGGVALGSVWGVASWRSRVTKAIEKRREAMRLELYTVTHMMAMLARANHTPTGAARVVVQRGQGPVVDELGQALVWIADGMTATAAFDRLAAETPEPAAARVYRLLAEATTRGSDVAESMLAISDTLRTERREDLERLAIRRRGAMIAPTLLLMAPVVILYIVAPIPRFLFGAG